MQNKSVLPRQKPAFSMPLIFAAIVSFLKLTPGLFVSLVLVFLLGSCGGDSGGGDGGGDGASSPPGEEIKANTIKLSLSGADTAQLGSELEVSYYAYRENFIGAATYLVAVSSAITLDVVRSGYGEVDISGLDLGAFQPELLNNVVLNILERGISMRINIAGDSWFYSIACPAPGPICDNISFTPSARTVVLNDVIVEPSSDPGNKAIGNLVLSGTLSWSLADENPNAPVLSDSGSISQPPVSNGSELSLQEITGVWDIGIGNDERYYVIRADGTVIDYNYLGDASDQGPNCYEIDGTYRLDDQGNGTFNFSDDEGDDSLASFYRASGGIEIDNGTFRFLFKSTGLMESDLVPPCS